MSVDRMWRRRVITTLVVAGACAYAPPAMAASTRYASPTGGGDCSAPNPCTLTTAVNGASAGDEVVVAPGNYSAGITLNPTGLQLSIHGVAGQPAPVIASTQSGGNPALYMNTGGSLRHLRFQMAGNSARIFVEGTSTYDDLIVEGSGPQFLFWFFQASNSAITNVVVRSVGQANLLIQDSTGVSVRNLTSIVDSGTGEAFRVENNTANASANVLNSVFRAGADLNANQSGGHVVTIMVDYSSYRPAHVSGAGTVTTGTHNQAADPVFVNAAAGDFHQAAGSPTINAGTPDTLLGPIDIDGDLRTIGTAPDIGADEAIEAPVVTTGAADAITTTAATIAGGVNPRGPATVHFEYGTTPAYGQRTADQALAQFNSEQPLSAALDGLAPGTTYHYRLVGANSGGTTNGADATFTTRSVRVEPPPPPPPPASRPAVRALTLTPAKFRAARSGATVATAVGTRVTFTLSEAADVAFAAQRRTTGARRGSKCVKRTRALRRAKRCVRWVAVGRFSRASTAGANQFSFRGRFRNKPLAPGLYRLQARPINTLTKAAGNTITRPFQIVRR